MVRVSRCWMRRMHVQYYTSASSRSTEGREDRRGAPSSSRHLPATWPPPPHRGSRKRTPRAGRLRKHRHRRPFRRRAASRGHMARYSIRRGREGLALDRTSSSTRSPSDRRHRSTPGTRERIRSTTSRSIFKGGPHVINRRAGDQWKEPEPTRWACSRSRARRALAFVSQRFLRPGTSGDESTTRGGLRHRSRGRGEGAERSSAENRGPQGEHGLRASSSTGRAPGRRGRGLLALQGQGVKKRRAPRSPAALAARDTLRSRRPGMLLYGHEGGARLLTRSRGRGSTSP